MHQPSTLAMTAAMAVTKVMVEFAMKAENAHTLALAQGQGQGQAQAQQAQGGPVAVEQAIPV